MEYNPEELLFITFLISLSSFIFGVLATRSMNKYVPFELIKKIMENSEALKKMSVQEIAEKLKINIVK